MRQIILAAILAAAFGVAHAGTSASANSGATVGSLSVTGNIGNGVAVEGSRASAGNTSTATALRIGPVVVTSANSAGGTSSSSAGFAWHAFGVTGAVAGQTGNAAAHASF